MQTRGEVFVGLIYHGSSEVAWFHRSSPPPPTRATALTGFLPSLFIITKQNLLAFVPTDYANKKNNINIVEERKWSEKKELNHIMLDFALKARMGQEVYKTCEREHKEFTEEIG